MRGHGTISGNLNWQQFQVVASIARTGSIKGAARDLGLSEATVRKKLEHVEQIARVRLFDRTAGGLVITDDGDAVASAARRMEERAKDIEHTLRSRSHDHLGEVKVSVTEGLGTFWVIPRLTKMQIGAQNIGLAFDCSMVPPDMARGEADVAVHFDPLPGAETLSRKIADVEVRLYANNQYLAEYGDPRSIDEMKGHRFIRQIGPQVDENGVPAPLQELIGEATAITTNTSSAHFYAVANGAGIGALPTYATAVTNQIRELSLPFALRREVYLSVRPEREKVKRVRVVIDWIGGTFDPNVYPYFRQSDGFGEAATTPVGGDRFFEEFFASGGRAVGDDRGGGAAAACEFGCRQRGS